MNAVTFADKSISVELIGDSPAFKAAAKRALKAARFDLNILLLGEVGVGKTLMAKLIHENSQRSSNNLVRIDPSWAPDTLYHKELFGAVPNAYTDAPKQGSRGMVHQAQGGTLFLDNVNRLTHFEQIGLLAVLEEGEFRRVGGDSLKKSDFRLISSYNEDLNELRQSGRFLPDFFSRIDGLPIEIPPLRSRAEDIPVLAANFMAAFCHKYGIQEKPISGEALNAMQAYFWPQNIRQLKNVCEQAAAMSEGTEISVEDLPAEITDAGAKDRVIRSAVENLMDMHIGPKTCRDIMVRIAFENSGGNLSRAARISRIPRQSLSRYFKAAGLS